MASREDEKRRRREARQAAEEAERRRQARAARMRSVAVAIVTIAFFVLGGVLLFARNENASDAPTGSTGAGFVDAAAPAPRTDDLDEAARLADCTMREDKEYPAEHTTEPVTYETNPPTSGRHDPVPADDGAYAPGNTLDVEPTVHSLEHGRINIQWKPGTSERRIGQLKSVFDERDAYHVLLYENQTDMPYAVAATAWTQALTCNEINDRTFDAIRAFRARFTDQGPEFVP